MSIATMRSSPACGIGIGRLRDFGDPHHRLLAAGVIDEALVALAHLAHVAQRHRIRHPVPHGAPLALEIVVTVVARLGLQQPHGNTLEAQNAVDKAPPHE
jgi:hypothetical protein